VQACGDAHLANFGLFASSERRLVFDINDFDETLPGPWEWDVKRLATSLEIAGRDNEFSAKQWREIVVAAVAAYRRAMRSFAVTTALQVWYAIPDAAAVKAWFDTDLDKTHRKRLTRALDKARTKDNLGALSRYAGIVDGRPRIVADPPLVVPLDELVGEASQLGDVEQALRELLRSYRSSLEPERRALLDQYRLVDFALKVVGVGSMGTRSYIALLLSDDVRDPLFLQAKEAGPSGWKGSAEIGVMVPQGMRVYGVGGRWRVPTLAPGTASGSRPISAPARHSTVPSVSSPGPTRTRTSVTTGRWWTRSAEAGSRPSPGCSGRSSCREGRGRGGGRSTSRNVNAELREDSTWTTRGPVEASRSTCTPGPARTSRSRCCSPTTTTTNAAWRRPGASPWRCSPRPGSTASRK
jgi:uncharacterized protein (DUF2252 family)